MAIIKYPQDIVVELLRANISDPKERYLTDSETFISTDGQTDFIINLTNSNRVVRAIKTVTLDGTELSKWKDYDIDLDIPEQPTIILKTPANLDDELVIEYYCSSSGNEWIYPDFPIGQLNSSKFPRISVIQITKSGIRQGTYDSALLNQVHLQIDCWTKDDYSVIIDNKNYTKQALADYLGNLIEKFFCENEDLLYPKLHNYELIDSNPMPYEEDSQTYRHKVEIILMGENVGL